MLIATHSESIARILELAADSYPHEHSYAALRDWLVQDGILNNDRFITVLMVAAAAMATLPDLERLFTATVAKAKSQDVAPKRMH